MPHELWHDTGVKFVQSRFGDVFSVDQYCMQGDYTSVRALVMIAAGLSVPESMIVRLPISHEVKLVTLKVMQRWAHGVDVNPFAGNSEASLSSGSSGSRSPTAEGWAGPDCPFPPRSMGSVENCVTVIAKVSMKCSTKAPLTTESKGIWRL
ncbi:hypothetical protein D1007_21379 [Hordeum vulgare]|nr:hypothetical protein D1007_21379 [Hordeum vulgare]